MSNNIHQRVFGGGGVQLPSLVQLFATLLAAAHQASLSFAIYQSFLKYISIESVMLSNHLVLCHPLLLLPSVFPNIRVFSSESALHIRWPKYWSFSFSITVQKRQFFSTQTLWSNSHTGTRLLEKPQLRLDGLLSAKRCLCFLICCLGLLSRGWRSLVGCSPWGR